MGRAGWGARDTESMSMTSRLAGLPLPLLLSMTASCTMNVAETAAGGEPPQSDKIEEDVQRGTETLLRPEVGGQGCTFTLITSKLFLTAAHCGGHSPLQIGGDVIRFIYPDGRKTWRDVDRIYSLSTIFTAAHGSDLAIGRLVDPITDMTPATMQTVLPAPGTPVTLVGYGCIDASDRAKGAGIKHYGEGTFPKTSFACPGDSGGPLFSGNFAANGQMISVMSGQGDVYSHLGHHSERLAATIRSMSNGLEPEFDRPGPEFVSETATTGAACAKLCDADPRCRCFSFHLPSKTCRLKAAMFPLVPAVDYDSGVPGSRSGARVDYPGNDLELITNMSADACRGQCARRNDCAAFTSVGYNCQLKSAVSAKVRCSGCTSDVRRGFEQGWDRPGGDMSQVPGNDAKACAAWCEVVDTCRAFTFVPSQSLCYLKSSVPPPLATAATAQLVSGVKRGLEVNVERRGSDIHHFGMDEAIPQICQARCAMFAGCSSWTMTLEPPGPNGWGAGHCWLKSGFPEKVPLAGAVSGTTGEAFF
jgi:hypothetical protein